MASIFTYDPNPPRVSSPWLLPEDSSKRPRKGRSSSGEGIDDSEHLSETELDKLEAEPQDGPIEYKLHLLLRPRRRYESTSTSLGSSKSPQPRVGGESKSAPRNSPLLSASSQTRQNRLQQLTTQLLWRLQQSSPYHASATALSTRDLVIPKLPKDIHDLGLLEKPAKLLPGLEESNGALYEIGVSDDGTFVGLTKDEMDESMTTLKIMAASLGCRVEVQRMKIVGACEWYELQGTENIQDLRRGDLWVAEALIMPILGPIEDSTGKAQGPTSQHAQTSGNISVKTPRQEASNTQQLRISLTGTTNTGKTSLLGALAHGVLDNGRGSSRLSLFKHRHEIESGQTSSVTQELIGYKDDKIYNYAYDNVESWTDIHTCAEGGRLVFFSDSAGHSRFRRTILRGLVGWDPHWTFLCIAANEAESPSVGTHSISGANGPTDTGPHGFGVAIAHLDLCLRRNVPLVIIITKYELATAAKEKLAVIFSKIKAQNRVPKLLVCQSRDSSSAAEIGAEYQMKVQKEVLDPIKHANNPLAVVPVVLTSAVKGWNIGLIHALLSSLPLPPAPTSRDYVPLVLNPEQPAALFHIDDKYELPSTRSSNSGSGSTIVVAGYLRFGKVSIGDKVVLGPFQRERDQERELLPMDHPSPGYTLSISHPSSSEMARLGSRNAVSASATKGEWHKATILNIRNLRLPVQTLELGQVGTIEIMFEETEDEGGPKDGELEPSKPNARDIRKGQVLAIPSKHMLDTGISLQAVTGFTATFEHQDVKSLTIGSQVNVYVATVRATAKILHVARQGPEMDTRETMAEDNDDVFGMVDSFELEEKTAPDKVTDVGTAGYNVSFELLNVRDWIELGSNVVILEGGRKDRTGLEGYVGKVIEIVE